MEKNDESQSRSFNSDTSEVDDIRNTKQEYLRTEIINKGYNPQEFAAFMEQEKTNGSS